MASDPYQIAETVRLLSQYTPDLDENPDEIAYTLEETINGGYLSTNGLLIPTPETGSLPDENVAPVTETDERKSDSKYTVQIGDTISGIGEKFSLKMATIRVKNNMGDIDSIKPGQELTIPPADLSDKAVKAAEDRRKASADLAQSKTKKIISSKCGNRGLIVPIRHNGISRGIGYGHTGIDYRANIGTPVTAAADGTIAISDESGWNSGFGKTVVLKHSGNMTTRYAHMSDVVIAAGQQVDQGEIIGYSGNTGRSTGPHLHFELRVNGAVKNPSC